MKKILFPILMLAVIAVTVFSCKSKTAGDDDFEGKILDAPLLKHVKTARPSFEGFWQSIDTILLDNSTTESLVGAIKNIKFTNDYIFIHSNQNALHIFDYQGNFVRKIQKVGRGRGEYDMLVKFDIQENAGLISILDGANIMRIYTFEGEFVRQFEVQQYIDDFAVLPNGHYLMYNTEDQSSGIRGLYETDEQGVTIQNLFEIPDYFQLVSHTSPYLIHLNDSVISCMGLEYNDFIYHYEDGQITPVYKIRTDIEFPIEIMQSHRWDNPDKQYSKTGFWESDRFLGITVTNFREFVQIFYDKKEDQLYRFDLNDMNDSTLWNNPLTFQYADKGKLVICYDPEIILEIPKYKVSFPKVTLDSNPILVIWQ